MKQAHPFDTEEAKRLFEAIARTLNAWNFIERELSLLFCRCINFSAPQPAERVYWAARSFDLRLQMVDEVVSCQLFDQPELAEWTTINNRLSRRSKQRNKLAHGSVFNRRPNDATTTAPHLFLSPFDDTVRAQNQSSTKEQRNRQFPKGLPKDRMYTEDISVLQSTFNDDANNVSDFIRKVEPLLRAAAIRQRKNEANLQRLLGDARKSRTPARKKLPPQS